MSADPPTDPVLLFLHIPKTAGTSVRQLLKASYDESEWLPLYNGAPEGPMSPADLAAMPEQEKGLLRMVYGHFSYGIHEYFDQPTRYLTILRNPVDRLGSLYDMYRETQPDWVAGLSFVDWITKGRSLQTDNEMVRHISGRQWIGKGMCTEDMLDEALQHIRDQFQAVLTMEALTSESLSNAVQRPLGDLPRVGSGVRSLIDEGIRKRVEQLNWLDMSLWQRFAGPS